MAPETLTYALYYLSEESFNMMKEHFKHCIENPLPEKAKLIR